MQLRLTVNGRAHELDVPAQATLLDVLRDELGLTGTKQGCNEGECGACTVLVDGKAVDSCVLMALAAAGSEIVTVEGLAAPDGTLSPLQRAFVEAGGVQCGFCTPGFLMTLTAALRETPAPSEDEIRAAIAGNICRCTGYTQIVEAVQAAARMEARG
ncbi:MAG TPA: (2Fe-2S)-binding protein [Gaiellaceae bacterium]|nr:(2Fe-2S)-binding protein [Gaiellaceae bacterium]